MTQEMETLKWDLSKSERRWLLMAIHRVLWWFPWQLSLEPADVVCADYDKCPLFWTSGQRAKLNHATLPSIPYVWKLRTFVWQTMFDYDNWPLSAPSPAGDCVHMSAAGQQGSVAAGTWGTSACETRLCVICECHISNDHDDDKSAH